MKEEWDQDEVSFLAKLIWCYGVKWTVGERGQKLKYQKQKKSFLSCPDLRFFSLTVVTSLEMEIKMEKSDIL